MENYTPSATENNTRENDLHERRSIGESSQEKIDIICTGEISQLFGSLGRKFGKILPIRGQIHKVQPQIRKNRHDLYDPVLVSLGPYHHGKPELQQAQEFKYICLNWCAEGSEQKIHYFYSKVFEKIDALRGCYAEVSVVEKYDDKALAMMMLLDACFIVSFMDITTLSDEMNSRLWYSYLGVAAMEFMSKDFILLENQIPLEVIKLIISLKYETDVGDGKYLLAMYISRVTIGKMDKTLKIPREDKDHPKHLLEAIWRVLAMAEIPMNEAKQESSSNQLGRILARGKKKDENAPRYTRYTCHSVTDLKSKGIHFKPSSSHSIIDIQFKSHAFHGEIQLPTRNVSNLSKVLQSNMIAYELSPATSATELSVLSYTCFMKSLIQNPTDVKELQEKKILNNTMASHEQVVKVFQEIDTFGFDTTFGIFNDVKHEIAEHCSSKAKTWLADLINTRFKSPWTTIALAAAIFLLCLTFLQTYFTINPQSAFVFLPTNS